MSICLYITQKHVKSTFVYVSNSGWVCFGLTLTSAKLWLSVKCTPVQNMGGSPLQCPLAQRFSMQIIHSHKSIHCVPGDFGDASRVCSARVVFNWRTRAISQLCCIGREVFVCLYPPLPDAHTEIYKQTHTYANHPCI